MSLDVLLKMKKILLIHIALWIITGALFYSLGSIDKKRLDRATITHKPSLLFAYDKLLVQDGGSIYWRSLMYSANEHRRMRVWEKDDKTEVGDDFNISSHARY